MTPARAAPTPGERARAAQEFDGGVAHFENAEYEAAARAFLRADVLAPNSEAIANAIAAARKANDHLLVAEAAERGISRQDTDPGLAATARQALAESSRHLARIELGCEPAPCAVWLDGARVEAGRHYALPGTHGLAATRDGGTRVEETHNLLAGTTYRVVLHVTEPGSEAVAASVAIEAPAEPASAAPAPQSAAPADPPRDGSEAPRGLDPAWFYASAAVTAGLAGVWIWSGVDALSAKGDLPRSPGQGQIDDVRGKAIRTDVLLGATLAMGAVTAYLGVAGVDWGGETETAFVVAPGGAFVSTRGAF